MKIANIWFPRIAWKNVGFVVTCAVLGALIAGTYGVLHDQITYCLSESYFTEFKFHQFASSDPRLRLPSNATYTDRIFVAVIGFLATWWVGLVSGWFLGRASILPNGAHPTIGQIARYFLVIIGAAALFGFIGFCWESWRPTFSFRNSRDFMLVGQIHNFGYLGALVGLTAALILVRRARRAMLGNCKDTIANRQ